MSLTDVNRPAKMERDEREINIYKEWRQFSPNAKEIVPLVVIRRLVMIDFNNGTNMPEDKASLALPRRVKLTDGAMSFLVLWGLSNTTSERPRVA